jgi:tetratricopeptide (TPR) repeat protein
MSKSPLKRLWDAVKPPPAPPRRVAEYTPLRDPSWVGRFLRSIKPPPAVNSARQGISPEEKLRRRRIVRGAAALVAAGGAAWGTYFYISSAPARATQAFQDGMRLMGKSDLKGAEQRFTKALSNDPQLASAYLERGLVRSGLQDADAAVQDFEHALALDQNMAPAHTGLGLIYRGRGDVARAINEFTLSIQLASNTDALYQRGQLYESLGQHEKAIADYDAAIHEQPDAPHVYRARAMARETAGDHAGAEEDRGRAHRIESHDSSASAVPQAGVVQ